MKTLNKNIEKILNRNKNREQAQKIQTNKYGKHYITDGYILVEFKEDIPELSNYAILDYEQSFKLDDVFDNLTDAVAFEDLAEQDKFILQNVKHYNKFYKECIKGQEGYYQSPYVVLLDTFYNSILVNEVVKFIGIKDLKDTKASYKIIGANEHQKILVLENDTLRICLMPLRFDEKFFDGIQTNLDLFKTYVESKGL